MATTKKTLTIIDPKTMSPIGAKTPAKAPAKTPVKANIDTSALEKFLLERLEYLSLREERMSNRSINLYDDDLDSDYGFEYDDGYIESLNYMCGNYVKDDYSDDSEDETINDYESYWDKTYHNF